MSLQGERKSTAAVPGILSDSDEMHDPFALGSHERPQCRLTGKYSLLFARVGDRCTREQDIDHLPNPTSRQVSVQSKHSMAE